MTRSIRTSQHRWAILPAILLAVYVVAYLLTTEVFRGELGGTRHRIRLFHSEWHQRFFKPLLGLEQRLRPATTEFSCQLLYGASLPPPEP